MEKVGITSHKPKTGTGHGGPLGYATYYKSINYAGWGYLNQYQLAYLISSMVEGGVRFEANILAFVTNRDNDDWKYYFLFFQTQASCFVFKSYIVDMPDKLKESGTRRSDMAPILSIW